MDLKDSKKTEVLIADIVLNYSFYNNLIFNILNYSVGKGRKSTSLGNLCDPEGHQLAKKKLVDCNVD